MCCSHLSFILSNTVGVWILNKPLLNTNTRNVGYTFSSSYGLLLLWENRLIYLFCCFRSVWLCVKVLGVLDYNLTFQTKKYPTHWHNSDQYVISQYMGKNANVHALNQLIEMREIMKKIECLVSYANFPSKKYKEKKGLDLQIWLPVLETRKLDLMFTFAPRKCKSPPPPASY